MKDISDKTRVKDLETIIVLSIMLIVFSFVFHVDGLLFVAIGILALGVISKSITHQISRVWLGLAHRLGVMNTRIILSLIFYLFLTPIAVVYRFLGKNQIVVAKDESLRSYYTNCNKTFKRDDFEKMW